MQTWKLAGHRAILTTCICGWLSGSCVSILSLEIDRTMAGTGLDDPGVFYSDAFFSDDRSEAEGELSRTAAVKRFKEFIKTFMDHTNSFCYRYVRSYYYINRREM